MNTAVPTVYDVLVLGGGSAGCALAVRLSEDPDRAVCLVEAGPDYGAYDEGRWPADLLDGRALAFSHSWETDHEDHSQLRARVLGGCSAHNACIVLRGAPADYDEWGPGWTHAAMEPYLDRAEATLGVRQFEGDELSPWHRAFPGWPGTVAHTVNARGAVRWNSAFAYLDPARGRSNLTILADALVDKVLLDPPRVVTSRGELAAPKIVLAAGAYGTPGILLRSGIGPDEELREHRIPVVVELPVGEGLADHVGINFGWEATPALQEETSEFEALNSVFAAQVSVLLRSSRCTQELWDLLGLPWLDPGYDVRAIVFAMKPDSRGRVRLNGPEPEQPLDIEHGFLADPRDVDVLAEGVELLREIASSPAVGRYAGRELEPGPGVETRAHIRAAARGFFHPVGTCALGSVCDEDGRVLGAEGLVVGDASLIPAIPRANTNISVIAVAEAVVDRLRSA